MKRIPTSRRFRTKIIVSTVAMLLIVLGLSDWCVYRFTVQSQLNSLRERLKAIAQTAASGVNAAQLMQIPLSREGMNTPQFAFIAQNLQKIKDANPQIAYIYILTQTEIKGVWRFVVDPAPDELRESGHTSFPGDRYQAGRYEQMIKSLEGPSADTELERDQWGVTLSGYAPIRNSNGETVAVLGVDMLAEDVHQIRNEVIQRLVVVLLIGIGISLVTGIWLGRRISEPVTQLVEGTRRIADGDLDYRVNVNSQDEIGELARSFNQMTERLKTSQDKLLNYFYDVVNSFVLMLEARDQYTKGHSEAVAAYSEKIAAKMGFSPKTVEMVKRVALLHDIGKIGIKDSVLNKPGKLTPEEWEELKKHPVLGEQILKPILGDSEMMAIVRNHHERADGMGYPDQQTESQMNVFAAIVAVADAYDAMTSDRAYRKALTRKQAREQLVKNRGTQFHPRILDIFLEILDEEASGKNA